MPALGCGHHAQADEESATMRPTSLPGLNPHQQHTAEEQSLANLSLVAFRRCRAPRAALFRPGCRCVDPYSQGVLLGTNFSLSVRGSRARGLEQRHSQLVKAYTRDNRRRQRTSTSGLGTCPFAVDGRCASPEAELCGRSLSKRCRGVQEEGTASKIGGSPTPPTRWGSNVLIVLSSHFHCLQVYDEFERLNTTTVGGARDTLRIAAEVRDCGTAVLLTGTVVMGLLARRPLVKQLAIAPPAGSRRPHCRHARRVRACVSPSALREGRRSTRPVEEGEGAPRDESCKQMNSRRQVAALAADLHSVLPSSHSHLRALPNAPRHLRARSA